MSVLADYFDFVRFSNFVMDNLDYWLNHHSPPSSEQGVVLLEKYVSGIILGEEVKRYGKIRIDPMTEVVNMSFVRGSDPRKVIGKWNVRPSVTPPYYKDPGPHYVFVGVYKTYYLYVSNKEMETLQGNQQTFLVTRPGSEGQAIWLEEGLTRVRVLLNHELNLYTTDRALVHCYDMARLLGQLI